MRGRALSEVEGSRLSASARMAAYKGKPPRRRGPQGRPKLAQDFQSWVGEKMDPSPVRDGTCFEGAQL